MPGCMLRPAGVAGTQDLQIWIDNSGSDPWDVPTDATLIRIV